MSDIADDAQENIERTLYLAQVLRRRENLPTGACLICEEPTPGSFCSPECRDDYEKRQKLRNITGR